MHVQAVLLALSLGSVLAHLEPDSASGVAREPVPSLTSLLRDQVARQPRNTSEQLTTTTAPQTTIVQTTTTTNAQETLSSTNKPQFQYVKPLTAYPKCHYLNQTFMVGQKWNDDCIQVCECVAPEDGSLVGITACRPRCPVYNDPPGDVCRLLRSKQDPQCCLELVCETQGKQITTTTTNNESGQLNVTTTDIKLHAPVVNMAPSGLSPQAPTTTTTIPTTTTTTLAPPTTTVKPTQEQQKKVIPTTIQQQVPTTTILPTTIQQQAKRVPTTTNQFPTSVSPLSSRAPKQVVGTDRTSHIFATQSPANLAPQRSQSLITTTNLPAARALDLEARQSSPIQALFTTTTTTTEASPLNSSYEVDPSVMDLCILPSSPDSGYRVNESWLNETCNYGCRCVFRSEPRDPTIDVSVQPTINMNEHKTDDTEIRCSLPTYCSPIPAKLKSTYDCPNPRLMLSEDKCICPRVACSPDLATTRSQASLASKPGQIFKATTIPTSERPVQGCKSKQPDGRLLEFGETFNDECHSTCRCYDNGEVRCQQLICPMNPPESDVPCAEWTLERNFKPNSSENRCCPQFICKEPGPQHKACMLMGKEIAHGFRLPEEIHPRNPECEKVCTCTDGKIICQPLCPTLSETPPEDLKCSSDQAYRTSDDCCPRWLCPIPITEEYALRDFSVMPMNATAVEVSFVLPLFAVGRKGTSELNYTGSPNSDTLGDIPPSNAQWVKKANIRTTGSIFASQMVKYHLNNLKPNYKYWFKLVVHFNDAEQPLDDPLESQIQRVVMPPSNSFDLPEAPVTTTRVVVTSTSTTTTTTTPPPTRILQPNHYHSGTPVTTSATKITPSSSTPTTSTTTTESPPTTTTDTISTSTSVSIITTAAKTLNDIIKSDVSHHASPCSKDLESNQIDDRIPLAWTDQIQSQMNAPLQRYAWHLLVAFSIMTILFTIVSYLYLKKSSRVIAPITSQSAYDNPTFTKLVSYYANQPHVLLVDENNQNYNNDAILARQKNLEVDKSSPLHHHQMNDIHHQNGRQHLI